MRLNGRLLIASRRLLTCNRRSTQRLTVPLALLVMTCILYLDPDSPISGNDLSNFRDVSSPHASSDVPTFWHVPKSGGSTIKYVIGMCHDLVIAIKSDKIQLHLNETKLQVIHPGRAKYVNIDPDTVAGIQRAKDIGFPNSGLAQFIATTRLREANDLGSPRHRLRLFALFRHPIERAISMFYYLQVADWEPSYSPELETWSIGRYAQSDKAENNWMTRTLSNNLHNALTEADLDLAMEVLRTKFLVGLTSKMEESLDRFERYFHWAYREDPSVQENCRQQLVTGGANVNVKSPAKELPKEGDAAWELLRIQNGYDMELYSYIEKLYEEQAALVFNIPERYRISESTCCKCDPPTYPPEGFDCPS